MEGIPEWRSGDGLAKIRDFMVERGCVVLRGVLDERVLEDFRSGVDLLVDDWVRQMQEEGKMKDEDVARCKEYGFERRWGELVKLAPSGSVPTLFRRELHREEFFGLFSHPLLLDACRAAIGVKDAGLRLYPNYSVRGKVPDDDPMSAFNVSWHQDAGLDSDGSPAKTSTSARLDAFGGDAMVNVWVPLVDRVRKEDGAMKFLVGSHKWGLMEHETIGVYEGEEMAAARAMKSRDGIKIGAVRTSIAQRHLETHKVDEKAVPVETEKGDVVLFSNLLFHAASPNVGTKVRWSTDFRIQRADKPTLRPLKGHIVAGPGKIESPAQWERNELE